MTRFTPMAVAVVMGTGLSQRAYAQVASPTLRAEVQAFVKSYTDAANRADATAYVEHYKQSADLLTVNDGVITRGWNALKDESNQMLGTEGAFKISMGAIDVVPLGPGRALAIGPFVMTLNTQQGPVQVRGAMTLVLEKTGTKWLIVHDHTSAAPANPK
jgi:uncharacterized protein (TIGR02246 family)